MQISTRAFHQHNSIYHTLHITYNENEFLFANKKKYKFSFFCDHFINLKMKVCCSCHNIQATGQCQGISLRSTLPSELRESAIILSDHSILVGNPDLVMVHFSRNSKNGAECAEMICKKCLDGIRVIKKLSGSIIGFPVKRQIKSSAMLGKSFLQLSGRCPPFLKQLVKIGKTANNDAGEIKQAQSRFDFFDTDFDMMFSNRSHTLIGSGGSSPINQISDMVNMPVSLPANLIISA